MSCADLRWKELSYIISKLNNPGLRDNELKNLSYQDKCNLLNNNLVLVARYFQYNVEVFFRETILDGPLEKTKYYVLCIEFHRSCILHNALIIVYDAAYNEFTEKTINTLLPDHLSNPELPTWAILSEKTSDEKQVLTWRNTLLREIKSYIDNNLNSIKVNMTDPIKDNFIQPLTIK